MNSNDILDMIGDAKDIYVWDTQQIRSGATSTGVQKLPVRKMWLIAAIIAMLLMLVGCVVVYILSMESLKVGDRTEIREIFEYDPNTGEAIAYVGKEAYVEQVFTIAGLQDSPASQAAQEWFTFTQTYDPDRAIQHAVWGVEKNFPEAYDSYHTYTDTMKEKIDEISQKYGLKLAGKRLDFKTSFNVCDALGIKAIQSSENDLFLMIDHAMCWENGNFYLAFDVAFPKKTGTELSYTYGTIHWNRKDCFSDDVIAYEDTGDWKEWEYTTTSGHKTVITASPSHRKGYIICDRGEAVMSIMVENQWSYRDGGEVTCLYLTDQQMEQLADAIDYAIQPQVATQEDVDNQIPYIGDETQAGYTVKVKSVKTDGWLARIVLGITAPEGTVISRNPHEGFEDTQYHIGFLDSAFLPNRVRTLTGENGDWSVQEDNDGLENTVNLVLNTFAEMEDGSAPFGWGTVWNLWIEDLVGSYRNDSKHILQEDVLAESGWRFDIGFNERNGDYRKIEFAKEPLTLTAITGFTADGADVFEEVEVTSFSLHTMSAVIRYDYDYAVDFTRYDMPMYVVMKDGRQIEFQPASGDPGVTRYIMESHVNVDEVDHILLMDGSILRIPER